LHAARRAGVNVRFRPSRGRFDRRRTRVFTDAHPEPRLINLGIGDVTRPLPPAVVHALHEAVDELARADSFKGYGPCCSPASA